ncbi:MAG: hypothetical protein LBH99_04700 [Rickettsia sp.]|jgi:preprotein translocase subunit SecA|nr:hypothetical protein [Rickettsia sp.]
MAKAINHNQIDTDMENFFNQDNSSLYYLIATKSEYIKPNFFETNYKFFSNSSDNGLTQVIQEFKSKLGDLGIFIICELEINSEKQWITINMIKSEESFKIDFSYPKDDCKSKKYVRSTLFKIIEAVFKFSKEQIKKINDTTQPYLAINKSKTIQKMWDFIQDLGKIGSDSDISIQSVNDLKDWLNKGFTTKAILQKIINYLKDKVDNDQTYYLKANQLHNLSRTLVSENFKPTGDDKVDLRLEVIKLLVVFKTRSSEFDQKGEIVKILQDYFKINKDKYKAEIADHKTTLEKLGKDEKTKTKLIRYIELRLEFLTNIATLSLDLLEINDFDEFIKLLGGMSELEGSLNSLKLDLGKRPQSLVSCSNQNQALDDDFHKNAYNQCNNQSYLYQAGDFYTLQNQIFSVYQNITMLVLDNGKNKRDDFGRYYNDIETVKKNLTEQLRDLSVPKLVYYNISNIHWVCFAALKHDGRVNILYKDSMGRNNDELKKQLEEIFGVQNVSFVHNTKREQTEGVECGIFALENMRVMAEQLTNHDMNSRNAFISEFANFPNFCNLATAKKLRKKDFAQLFVLGKYQEMVDSTINLSKLKIIRIRHFNEAQVIASKLQKLEFFQDLQIIALKDNQELDQSVKNTIAIQIASNSGSTRPELKDYAYYYHILFSKDLSSERITVILESIEKALRAPCDKDSKNFESSRVDLGTSKVAALAIRDDEVSIADIQISDLLDNLYVPYDSASTIAELLVVGKPTVEQYRYPDSSVLARKAEDLQASLACKNSKLITNLEQFIAEQKRLKTEVVEMEGKIRAFSIALDNKRVVNTAINIDGLIILLEQKVLKLEEVTLSKETLEVLVRKDASDKNILKALLRILNCCNALHVEVKVELEKFSSKTLSKLSSEDIDIVLEVKKLFSKEDLLKFAYKVLLTNKEAKNKILELIDSYKPVEAKHGYITRIVKFVNSYASCKEFISIPENRTLVEEIIGYDEVLPRFFIEEFKDYTQSISEQDKLNVIRVAKFLLQSDNIKLKEIGKIQILLDTANIEICSATLDIIYQELIRARKIDPAIQAKIREIDIDNESIKDKVKNILDKIEEFSEIISLLNNPREELERRRIAINNIVHPTPQIVAMLVDLIKYEQDLRSDAFKVLVKILPNDEVYSIDLEEVLYSMGLYITINNLDDLIRLAKNTRLVQKKIIINTLVKLACDYTKTKEESLEVLSKIDKQLSETRRLVFQDHEWEKIKTLRDLPVQINDLLLNTEENIKRRFLITEDKIASLINHLTLNPVKMGSEIVDSLLSIDLHQGLRDTNAIYEAIKNTELVKLKSIVDIVVMDICRGREVNPTIQECILSISMEGKQIVDLLYSFVARKAIPPISLLNLACRCLDTSEQDINLQIQIVELISRVIRSYELPVILQSVIDILKKMSLEVRQKHQDYLLNHTAFKALERVVEVSRDKQFLDDYVTSFKKRELYQYLDDSSGLQILDEAKTEQMFRLLDNTNVLLPEWKYYLLKALNSHYSNTQEIKTAFLLAEHLLTKHPIFWLQEILQQTLIIGSLRCSEQLSVQAVQVELKKFYKNIKTLFFIKEQKDVLTSNYLTNALQALVDKQQSYKFDIKVVNNILTFLNSKPEALEVIIQNDYSDWYLELQKMWLTTILEERQIVYSEEQIDKLSQYSSSYTSSIIEDILHKMQQGTKIDILLEFLAKLENSDFDISTQEEFLVLETRGLSDPNAWLLKLYKHIVEQKLDKKTLDIKLAIDKDDKEKLQIKLARLLSVGWLFSSIEQLIECVTKDNIKPMIIVLDSIYDYKLREYERNLEKKGLLSIFQDSPENWQKTIHDLAIFKTFTGSYDKEVAELNKEILELNQGKGISLFQEEKLMEKYRAVIEYYNTKDIRNWQLHNVTDWAADIKKVKPKRFTDNEQIQAIAVIKRAVELTGKKHSPRSVQLLSLLTMLNPEENKGRLAQINTGEGKTTIVAMLAAIKALEGNTVDIITSSSELAKPQSEEQKEFFVNLGLTVAYNCKSSSVNIKESYKANIVYGSAADFQGDILRDEYSKEGTRSGRGFGIAIVDEVDSMLIDSRDQIVMLSSPIPAMDHLEPLLALIWIQIGFFADSIVGKDGTPYKGGEAYYKVRENAIDEYGQLIEGRETLFRIENKEEFIKAGTKTYIRKILRDYKHLPENDEDGNNIESTMQQQDKALEAFKNRLKSNPNLQETSPSCFPRLNIPKHLEEFVTEVQLEKWVENAIHAQYRSQENKHYVVRDGKILPVDASNTGIVQQNTNWSDGLHQFLQIKHGAKITSESITTNFISNVTFFRRYKHNIYGLTGTLGGNRAQDLLNNTYNVDSVIIPPFKKKQYQELSLITANTEDSWYRNIVENSLNKLNNGRGVLVITKYITEVDEIKNRLEKSGHDPAKIKIYKTEDDSDIIEELKRDGLKPSEIIIATNIAGRGTDIKISSQVETNGGLHVCVTFLPPNERVAKQNEGRAARSGEKGTGQFILLEQSGKTIDYLKQIRDQKEEDDLQKARKEVVRITNKDAIFAEFCAWLEEIEIDRASKNVDKKSEFKALEERFGLWLKIQDQVISESTELDVLTKFKQFKETISKDAQRIQNPFYYVLIGNEFLTNKDYEKAIKNFDEAILLDSHFAVNAYYNRGYARLVQYGGDVKNNQDQIRLAITDLREARRIIEEHLEPMLYVIQKASSSQALSEQVRHKFTLYGVQKTAIESAVGIGVDGMHSRKIAADQQLNARINDAKIDQKKDALSGCSKEEVEKEITKFVQTLPVITKTERDQLRTKDIEDTIRARKIAVEEDKIDKELADLSTVIPCHIADILNTTLQQALPHQFTKENVLELKKDAFNNFKNGVKANSDQQSFYSQFEKNVRPTAREIADREKDIALQDDFLEKGAIGQALSKNMDMEIKFIDINDALPQDENISLYDEEIREYQNNGFKGALQVAEIKPIDWASVLGVSLLGLGQLIAGGAIAVFTLGAGSTIGMGLISEGVSDLITAIKDGIINRDFSWESYGIQKAISITVSLVCAGLGAIKDAAKTAISGVKQAISAVAQRVTQTVKQGWQIAAKAFGTSLAKGIAKEVITQVVNYGVNKALMPSIQTEIQNRLEKPIQNALLRNPKVKEMLELDGKNGNNKYQTLIKQKAMEILNPEQTQDSALFKIAQGIAVGIAKNKIPNLSVILQIKDAMEAIVQLSTFVSDFLKKLNVAIEKIYEDSDVDLSKRNEPISEVGLTVDNAPVRLIDSLSSSVSEKISNIVEDRLIKKFTSQVVNYGVDKFAAARDKALQESLGIYQAKRRLYFMQSGDRDNRVPSEFKEDWVNKDTQHTTANGLISQLANGGEAGLMHLGALSDIAGQPIAIYDKHGKILEIIGEDKSGPIINIQHTQNSDSTGHWIVLGNPNITQDIPDNNCLFAAVAAQCYEKDYQALRMATVDHMRANIDSLAHQIPDMERVAQYDSIMRGGKIQKYQGEGSSEVGEILNASQGKPSQAQVDREKKLGKKPAKGHPRAHTRSSFNFDTVQKECDFDSEEKIASVENITIAKKCEKTAFSAIEGKSSIKVQNSVAKEIMGTSQYEDARNRLNAGKVKIVLEIPVDCLRTNRNVKMDTVNNGKVESEQQDVTHIICVVEHDPQSTHPHIKTLYPTNKNKGNNASTLNNQVHGKDSKTGNRTDKNNEATALQGINLRWSTNIGWINSYFGEYTLNAIEKILELRINNVGLEDVTIARGYVFYENYNNLQKMINDLTDTKSRIVLAPLNLYNKHAVGIMGVKNQDNELKLYYLDPSNETIPDKLKQIFIDNGLPIEQLPAEQQKYANCGPEVIENFMLYLTGERLSQEESITYHSKLVEQKLVSKANNLVEVMGGNANDQESLNYPYGNDDQEEVQLNNEDVDIGGLSDTSCSMEYPAPISIMTEDAKLFKKDKDLNTNSDNNFINADFIREQDAFVAYSQGNLLSNEAWEAESDENEDRSLEAEQKFAKSLQLYQEAVKLSPTNIAYKHALDITSLKIEGNSLFSEGVELAKIAYELQEEANELATDQAVYNEILGKYQQALEFYQVAQVSFHEGWCLNKDARFKSCIEIVQDSIGLIQGNIEEIQAEVDDELIQKPNDITRADNYLLNGPIELFRQDDQDYLLNDYLIGNIAQELYYM